MDFSRRRLHASTSGGRGFLWYIPGVLPGSLHDLQKYVCVFIYSCSQLGRYPLGGNQVGVGLLIRAELLPPNGDTQSIQLLEDLLWIHSPITTAFVSLMPLPSRWRPRRRLL
jgi:hypothetical protein